MTRTEPERTPVEFDKRQFVVSVALAALFLFLFSIFSDLFSVRLREISSILAAAILKAFTFPVTREGTILSLAEMRFDVVPACSGSNTLQALIAFGILWCGLHPRLGLGKRLAAMLFIVPIALAANGVRVAMLAGAGFLMDRRIEVGFLHNAVGVIGFLAALGGFFLVTELLVRRRSESRRMSLPEMSLRLSGILLFFVFLPFLMKCLGDWKGNIYNRLDLYGYVFFFSGLAAYIIYWKRRPDDTRFAGTGSLLFITALAPMAYSLIRTPNHYVTGVSFLLVLFALAVTFKGFRFAACTVPFLIVIGLGYPKVTAFLNGVFGLDGINGALVLKTTAALALITATWLLTRRPEARQSSGEPPRPAVLFTLVPLAVVCVFAIQVMNIRMQIQPGKLPLRMSYLQGGWVGEDRPLDRQEREFFAGQNVLNRVYQKGENQVGVLVLSSSGDRKKIHPPEYCQTGAGWTIEKKIPFTFQNAAGEPMEATRLDLVREDLGLHRTMVYWFSDGKNRFPDFPSLVMEDTLKMLSSHRSEWMLLAAWTDQGPEVLSRFLSVMKEPDTRPLIKVAKQG